MSTQYPTNDKTPKESVPSTGDTVTQSPDKSSRQRDIESIPTGLPTSDRHAAETAHHAEGETKPYCGGSEVRHTLQHPERT